MNRGVCLAIIALVMATPLHPLHFLNQSCYRKHIHLNELMEVWLPLAKVVHSPDGTLIAAADRKHLNILRLRMEKEKIKANLQS